MARSNSKSRNILSGKQTLRPLNALMQRMFSRWNQAADAKHPKAVAATPRLKIGRAHV